MSSARAAEDPVFGDVALALAPRARRATGDDPDSEDGVRVEFDARALSERDRRALAEIAPAAPARLERRIDGADAARAAATPARRDTIACPRSALLDLGTRSEAAGVLLAAHDNARREPEAARVMGVVNVTPDSFSESSRFLDPARAIEHGLMLVEEGASWLDIGGESSKAFAHYRW